MKKNKNLIGIHGKSRSGKDTVATIIQYLFLKETLAVRDMKVFGNADHFKIFNNWTLKEKTSYSGWEVHRFADKLKQIVSLLTGIPKEDLEKEEVKSQILPQEWNYVGKVVRHNSKYMVIPGTVDPSMRGRDHTLSVRELLQLVGTDACRNIIHENIWVNGLFADYTSSQDVEWHKLRIDKGWTPPYCINCKAFIEDISQYVCNNCLKAHEVYTKKWIIPDLRFRNEFQAIKDRGGLTITIDRDYDKTNPKYKHQSETDLDDYRDKFDYIIDNNSSIEMLAKQVKTILTLEGII